MDVFNFREQLVEDYCEYIKSFVRIKDSHIQKAVGKSLNDGDLWPDPLIQLNPGFEPGGTVDELASEGLLHPECRTIFRRKPSPTEDRGPITFHRHQVEGMRAAQRGESYVLTTGTGSGKSLAYITPIVDHVLRRGSGRGVQAIIVYPMNALANSQEQELKKFLHHGYPEGKPPVTFRRYTGQEKDDERRAILDNPPDIILTNYVMLELILTRPQESSIVDAARGLRFLVLDELHTYRGRQGADVSMLVRRLRDRCEAKDLLCVGTSATLAVGSSLAQSKEEVAKVASLLFGVEVYPTNVIGESLRRNTTEFDSASKHDLEGLFTSVESWSSNPQKHSPDSFCSDHLVRWIEHTFGLRKDEETRILVRSTPRSLDGLEGAAGELAQFIDYPLESVKLAIHRAFLAGNGILDSQDRPIFAFRLHQFVAKGESVYASLESASHRYITVHPQKRVPVEGEQHKLLLPLAFCRECGQDYYVVRRVEMDGGGYQYLEMQFNSALDDNDGEPGYLYLDEDGRWPSDDPEALVEVVPEEWLEVKKGKRIIKYSRKRHLPRVIHVSPEGIEGQGNLRVLWIPAPFKFCLSCKIAYNVRQKSDYGKLSTLGSEGRSTATTILALGAVSRLKVDTQLSDEAKKLLSFTDNRQDASLQAGHFNDFVLVSLIRAALLRALTLAGHQGIRHEDLTNAVFEALGLSPDYYAQNPTVRFAARDAVDRALREVIGYHLYRDLRRGWRVVAPNLEQCGLLRIEYQSLQEACSTDDVWHGSHPTLVAAKPEERFVVCKTLLDFIRRSLAINVDYLKAPYQERIQQQSSQNLIEPWSIDEGEKLELARIVYARQGGNDDDGEMVINLSPRGGFGQYLRRTGLFGSGLVQKTEDAQRIIADLLKVLCDEAGILTKLQGGDHDGFQLSAGAIIWCPGDGKEAFHDPIRVPQQPEDGLRTNEFFVRFYREATDQLIGLEAREHTAQVQADERIDRETRFRGGKLPVLFCSPTMELGVDISDLNVVNMRNVPPTPANYAQRSGRAGRSGQPAFVYTYCATGSPHDSYYFKRAARMVAGAVAPPQLDVANEDLVRSHVQAIWLAESSMDLGKSLAEVVDVIGDDPSLEIVPSIRKRLNSPIVRNKARQRAQRLLDSIAEQLADADWYSPDWLERVLNAVPQQFENACQRWKGLYRSALDQMARQNMVRRDASRQQDWREAERLYNEAKQQLSLLVDTKNLAQSDFYSYRYFASEGFLPGYNFPRLPLSAYIPGRRGKKGREEFLSRPRFLAISEFGPRAFIYHEGSRYLVNRVILPVDRNDEEGDVTLTRRAKVCESCGYIHPLGKEPGPEKCDRCKSPLERRYENLFRMQSVVGKRRDRINCDEEERFRLGYQIISGVRFAEYGGVRSRKMAELRSPSGELLATIQYGQAATLWRMNIGWSRFKDGNAQKGFWLDTERGYWAKDSKVTQDDEDDPISGKTLQVIPYVEDRRNCILIEPTGDLGDPVIASLQAAIKTAVQQEYHLEDNELAAEGLPSMGQRRVILLYEAAEGGAGALRRLVEDRLALPRVASRALELCHFDPTTGTDLKRAPNAKEDCAIACYDCLLSYYNQRDHELLDRHSIKDLLMTWQKSDMILSSGELNRSQHLEVLKRHCDSKLEKDWLDMLEAYQLRLPSHGQHLIADCHTKPDFFYEDHSLAVYIDGPPHDFPERQRRDQDKQSALENHGFWVLRFHHQDDWIKKLKEHSEVFGKPEVRP